MKTICQLLALTLLLAFSHAGAKELERVILFSTDFCPPCLHVKHFFKEKQIPYSEFNISTNEVALQYFYRLGGQGTPLVLVDNQVLRRFQQDRFMALYEAGDSEAAR